jgi:hypothetical protein
MLSLQKFPEKPFRTLHFNKVALNMKKKKSLELSLSLSTVWVEKEIYLAPNSQIIHCKKGAQQLQHHLLLVCSKDFRILAHPPATAALNPYFLCKVKSTLIPR